MKWVSSELKWKEWRPWFAWYPVFIDGYWHWLKIVERRWTRHFVGTKHEYSSTFSMDYRLKDD